MALNQYISVKVCGNPDSNSGFVPLLLFNSPSFAVEDQFYVGFDNCSYFYTIKTTKSQTIYKLVKNNVRSYGAARAGSLVIAFSVPKNFTIEGGYTPYDVLEKLKDEFLKKCMTCKDAIRETYEFNPGRIDQHVLDNIASAFTLSPQPSPNRVMNPMAPKGYIVKSDTEIEKLFHDINYPEFDNYSEVIVADSANQTNYILINNIQIPRLKSYAIYVDGELKMSCSEFNQSLTVSSNKSPEFYDNKSVNFSIQNLKDGDMIPGVELQDVNERIVISTQGWATPKRRTIVIKIVPTEYENYFFTNSHLLKLTWPYGIIKLDHNLSFTLEGEQIAELKKGSIRLDLEQNGKFTISKSAIYDNELRVTVEVIKAHNVPRAGQHKGQQQENVTDLQIVKSLPVYDVSIMLLGEEKFEEGYEIDIKLKNHQEKPNIFLASCRTRFKAKSNKIFEGHFYVSKELHASCVYLYFQTNGKNYITKQPLYFSNDKVVVEESDFIVSTAKPFYKKKSFQIKLLISFIAILLGFIIGFASHDGINSLFGEKENNSFSKDSLDVDNDELMTESQAFDFLKDADDVLKKKDLKFSKVKELHDKYIKYKKTIEDVDERKFNNKVCDRIEDYNKVILYVTTGDIEKLKDAINDFDNNNLHIWPQHASLLKKILRDDTTIHQFLDNISNISEFAAIDDVIIKRHEEETNFSCNICSRNFSTEAELNSHRSSHVNPQTFNCNICRKVFSSPEDLGKHKNFEHHFTCSKCGEDMWFETQKRLNDHIKSVHSER